MPRLLSFTPAELTAVLAKAKRDGYAEGVWDTRSLFKNVRDAHGHLHGEHGRFTGPGGTAPADAPGLDSAVSSAVASLPPDHHPHSHAAVRAATAAHAALVRLTPAMWRALEVAGAVFDTHTDLSKFGWSPGSSGTAAGDVAATGDPVRAAVGVPAHVAATLAARVLGSGLAWARQQAGLPPLVKKSMEEPDYEGAGAVLAEAMAAVAAELGLAGVPDGATIAAALRGAILKSWNAADHPRGQPENAGEFAARGGGGGLTRADYDAKAKQAREYRQKALARLVASPRNDEVRGKLADFLEKFPGVTGDERHDRALAGLLRAYTPEVEMVLAGGGSNAQHRSLRDKDDTSKAYKRLYRESGGWLSLDESAAVRHRWKALAERQNQSVAGTNIAGAVVASPASGAAVGDELDRLVNVLPPYHPAYTAVKGLATAEAAGKVTKRVPIEVVQQKGGAGGYMVTLGGGQNLPGSHPTPEEAFVHALMQVHRRDPAAGVRLVGQLPPATVLKATPPDDSADPHAALYEAALEAVLAARESGDDAAVPGIVAAYREHLDDPELMTAALSRAGDDGEVMKAIGRVVYKAGRWDESKHPRGKNGKFIGKDRIQAAADDPALAEQLRSEVRPEDAHKLEAALKDQGGTVGRTKHGQRRHEAGARREKKKADARRASEIADRVGDGSASYEELQELGDHLEGLTADQLRSLQSRIPTAGRTRRKAEMVAALRASLDEHRRAAHGSELGADEGKLATLREAVAGLRASGATDAEIMATLGRAQPEVVGRVLGEGQKPPAPATEPEEPKADPRPGIHQDADHLYTRGEYVGDHDTSSEARQAIARYGPDAAAGGFAHDPGDPFAPVKHRSPGRLPDDQLRALDAEVAALRPKLFNKDRSPKKNAKPEDLARWAELTAMGEKEGDLRGLDAGRGLAASRHRRYVEEALAAGRPVPPEVLADYPDLRPPAAPPPDPVAAHRATLAADSPAARAIDAATHNGGGDRRRTLKELGHRHAEVAHEMSPAEEQAYTDMMGRLGVRPLHAPGETRPFDPETMQSESGISTGAPVRVTRRGWTGLYGDERAGHDLIGNNYQRAAVEPAPKAGGEPRPTMTQAERDQALADLHEEERRREEAHRAETDPVGGVDDRAEPWDRADDHLERMRAWQRDKPGSVAAEDAVGRAVARKEGLRASVRKAVGPEGDQPRGQDEDDAAGAGGRGTV